MEPFGGGGRGGGERSGGGEGGGGGGFGLEAEVAQMREQLEQERERADMYAPPPR